MFSLLAWSRVFAFFAFFLSLTTSAHAEESIFTSSVTYCNPPETLLIQRFELAYFPANTSVSFNVSVSAVQSNVNVTANIFLNVYGMNPVNVTVDLCGILKGALCPLPMYNFTGADTITLPSSLSVLKRIPGVAYKIPDLEGFAQLTLTEVNTGAVKACVQATISNGRSAHQRAVEWTTGGITIAAVVFATWQSIYPTSIFPFRLLESMYLYQSIASSAFLNLNYPSVYRAYALNFAWSMGLLSGAANSHLQNSINNMRHLTGGNLADAIDSSAVGLVNRKLSPYNSPSSSFVTGAAFYSLISPRTLYSDFTAHISNLLSSVPSSYLRPVFRRDTIVNGNVQTVTPGSSIVLQAGLPIYANTVHIATANVFMTTFFIVLILFAIAVATLAIGFISLFIWGRVISRRHNARQTYNFDYPSFAISWFLRVGLVSVFPLLVFIFYQWTLNDSWLSILISVITFILIAVPILYPTLVTLLFARRESPDDLYDRNARILARYGPLFAQYRSRRYYFFLTLLVAFVLRAIFISFAKHSGEAQVALLMATELGLILAYSVLKPTKTRGSDVFLTYLAITRFACTGLMIAFIERAEVKAIPRVVIGIIILIVYSVAVLFMIANLAWHAIVAIIKLVKGVTGGEESTNSPVDSHRSMMETDFGRPYVSRRGSTRTNLVQNEETSRTTNSDDGMPQTGGSEDGIEEVGRGRAINPTPEHSQHFDPYFLTPYPISPTGTTVTTMDPPSLYSRDSATITVGSLLPRRWSFSLSQPGSPADSGFIQGSHRTSLIGSSSPPSSPSNLSHGSHSQYSHSSHNSGLSKNSSTRASVQQHQLRHENIAEEEEGPLSATTVPSS
ncbi:hypothetical protein CPB84DRAFT_1775110 [Gymnopilus junonius]|uniref:ML-like domain-containing protein n=1 Tax=Gymnopilus junonius TaxID=109634 RepID=A0A9P5TQ42_GYMJU|nr:hypothetical protein CPB84DRAFT_1775110 [Gymnopilus junonius]